MTMRWRWAVLGLLCCLAFACRPQPTARPGMTDYRVARISFEGVEAVDVAELRDTLVTQRNTFNPFAPVSYYNRFELVSDIERIETFYADHGFFDARVVDHEVELDDDGRKERATIRFIVEEGAQTSLAEDARYDTTPLRSISDAAELVAGSPLRAGTPFDRAAIDRERERLRRELMERSYARARVEARVYVSRETHTARVYFFFDPGVACVFGDVEVVGNRNIPADLVRRNIDIRPGEAYRQSQLRTAQVELYDLDAFTSVEIEAVIGGRRANQAFDARLAAADEALGAEGFALALAVTDPPVSHPEFAGLVDNIDRIEAADPVVPIVITVAESPAANYKWGAGIAIESSRTEAYGRANATWRNVLSPLNRAELEGRLGYAWLPTVFGRGALASGIVGEVGAGVSRPRIVLGIFDASLRLGFEHGVETDHEFSRPSVRLALENRLGEFTRFELAYQFEINITRDFADTPATSAAARGSCDTLPRAFRMGYFETSIRSDRRDNAFERSDNDWAGSLAFQLGEGVLGDYPYARVDPELRYYRRITRRISLATRVGAGFIFDFGEPVPRNQCLFLGGGTSVRGYASRRVGPHQEADIPSGGVASYLFNFEPRIQLSSLFGLVAFFDAGQVSEGLDFNVAWGGAQGVAASVGGGLRIFTPIGPVRADVGVRINPVPAEHGRVRPVAFVLSLGEAF